MSAILAPYTLFAYGSRANYFPCQWVRALALQNKRNCSYFFGEFGLHLTLRHFKPILKRASLSESFRLYDLRHTCATLLLAANEHPKIVSERLGHATITLTLDTYSHVLPSMQQAASDKLERVLYG
jgi:integrase